MSGSTSHHTSYSATPVSGDGQHESVDDYICGTSSGRAGGECARVIGSATRSQQSQTQRGLKSRSLKRRACSKQASFAASPSNQEPTYWCTVCEDPAPITTCDGWKRHEKEQHEKGYVCMPYGPVGNTESDCRCAFCGLLNPNQRHLDTHGVALCIKKSVKDRRFTRRFQLVKHLETHGIFNGIVLADSWQTKVRSKYYSCGFCVALFLSHSDKLNHIDIYHFRHFQSIEEWDHNLVVRGLLLQPAVFEAWRTLSADDIRSTDLVWEPHIIANLRPRLEIGDEPADQLAADAFHQISFETTKSHPTLAPVCEAANPSAVTYHEARLGQDQENLMQNIDTRPEAFQDVAFLNSSHMGAPNLRWSDDTFQAMDLDFIGIHPPQIQTDYSYTEPEFTSPPEDAPSISTSLTSAFLNNSVQAQTSQQHPYTNPDLESTESRYSYAPSQRQPSTLASCCSPSLVSTNTSVHSLPLPLPSRQKSTQQQSHPQQQPAYPSNLPENPIHASHTGHRKSASFVAQLRNRLSRAKPRDANTAASVPMDIDFDDMMRIMEHDPRARANVASKHEVRLSKY